jgi:hypothetical protein
MFGNSEWFSSTSCCVAKPASKQGWLYLLAWAGVVFVPAALIYAVNQEVLAALFWIVPALAAFAFDQRAHVKAIRAKRRREQDVFFIGFDDAPANEAATPHYELRLRR